MMSSCFAQSVDVSTNGLIYYINPKKQDGAAGIQTARDSIYNQHINYVGVKPSFTLSAHGASYWTTGTTSEWSMQYASVAQSNEMGSDTGWEDAGTHDYIICIWINYETTGSAVRRIFDSRTSFYNGWGLLETAADEVQAIFRGTNPASSVVTVSAATFTPGWVMISLVADRDGSFYVYKNDVQVGSVACFTGSSDNAIGFTLGANTGGGNEWNSEIGIVAWYKFDGANGRPSALPTDWDRSIVRYNYLNTKGAYGLTWPDAKFPEYNKGQAFKGF